MTVLNRCKIFSEKMSFFHQSFVSCLLTVSGTSQEQNLKKRRKNYLTYLRYLTGSRFFFHHCKDVSNSNIISMYYNKYKKKSFFEYFVGRSEVRTIQRKLFKPIYVQRTTILQSLIFDVYTIPEISRGFCLVTGN